LRSRLVTRFLGQKPADLQRRRPAKERNHNPSLAEPGHQPNVSFADDSSKQKIASQIR
jgi:hypothetical protein